MSAITTTRAAGALAFLALFVSPYHVAVLALSPVLYFLDGLCRFRRRIRAGLTWSTEGKVVLITGASSGIGQSLAYECAKRKGKLVLVARRAEALAKVEEQCLHLGAASVTSVRTDVTDEAQVKALIEQVKEVHGTLDVLFLNAGVSMGEPFADIHSLDLFRDLMEVNYFGTLTVTQAALPMLRRSQGRIVVTSSVLGLSGVPYRTGYAAAKHAVRGFFESLQGELYDEGVLVTMVYPGAVRTEINQARLGQNPLELNMAGAMSSDECARLMVQGMEQGQKEIVMTHKFRAGRLLEGMVPHFWAFAVRRGAKKAFKKKDE
ncbi:hypothetical protein HDU85_002303 [Gaertneriomyces sp. JEL0708]|nr:hypothetical protein HDU85_002303 [Gaertneriomyces sp. JEL0708]